MNVAKHPASVSGTAIPPSTSINDASGAVWTVKSGVAYRAGQKAGFTMNITLLLWYAGKMYQQNVDNQWWVWQNSNWVASADPRPASTSGSTSGTTSTSGSTTTTTAASSTAGTTTSAAIPFFGVNQHYNYGGIYTSVPLATQAATLTDLGLTGTRQDIHSYDQIDTIANTVIPGMGSKITVMPMIDAYPWDDPSLNGQTPTEASAYAYAYSMAAYAATKFKGVPAVEFGNEYDLDSHNQPVANDGANVSDYDNNTWPIWRGALRGYYDGWRSVDTTGTTKIINTASSGFLHLGWYKGMLTGTQPDGSTGHPVVKTDIIQLHWYSDGGDPENTWGVTGTNYNVLKSLHDAYNLPIMFTEIGVNTDFSTAQAQTYINKTIPELVAAKATYNVIGFNWYELYDDPTGNYGIMTSSATQKPIYATIKAAVAASPVP
ncbi:glycosyl hydrolase [Paraburkholderia agricolaris]|uniref:glycosyl hydrolase n=1 Tax=Paraburkholderia agricolaris TaxID=2152888 RepID=UPI001FEB3398|nr:glycosyl hydrolase [Paraburkholderia agricolaris]